MPLRRGIALAATVLAVGLPWSVAAADAAVTAALEQRLKQLGVEAVNEHLALDANAFDLALLHRDTEGCVTRAVALTVELSRGRPSATAEAHTDSLRTALGRCPGLVLSRVSASEVPKVCSAVASWTLMQTVRELRRRMRLIEADEALRNSSRGKACSESCLHILKTTRVGLQASPPRRRP